MLVAGFAGLTAGVVQTRKAEREAVITAPAPAPTPTDRTPDMSTAAADRPPF
jgi:hypothetical protein